MAIRFGDAVKGFQEGRQARDQKAKNSMDALLQQAQLSELGYDVQRSPRRGLFGGGQQTLTRRPDYISTKDLEKQKLEGEIEDLGFKRDLRQKFGQGSSGLPSGMMVDPLTGNLRNDPNHIKPLNELQQAQLREAQRKEDEVAQAAENRNELMRQSSEDMLGTIQNVKKGAKYFGPLGNVPSVVAPSTIMSGGMDYGPRVEWEANVNKLLSGKVVEIMNQMKQASKTGATGFGAMNQSELQLLKEASTALKKNLPPDVAMKYLDQMEMLQQKFLGGGRGKFGQSEQSAQPVNDLSQMSDEELRRMAGL